MLKGTQEGMTPMTKVEEAIVLAALIVVSALWGAGVYGMYTILRALRMGVA